MPLAALRGLVVLAFVVPVSLGVLARSADANSFDAALRDASVVVVAAVDGTIASASEALMQPAAQTAAAGDGFWEWFTSLFGGGEETQVITQEEPAEPQTQVASPTPAPTPTPRISTSTPIAAPRSAAVPTSVPATPPTKTTERVIERTVVEPVYTTVVLPDPALEKRVSDLESRPVGGSAVVAIPVFNHEEGNDNTFTDSSINNPSINGGTIVNLAGLAADKSTTTNATSTTFYASLGRFAEAVIDTMTVTATNFATAVITTLTATNATLTNATSTNATSTNLYVSGQTTIGALSGFLRATAGVVSTALVNLASDVTGILPVSSGGTGWAALASGFIPFGNGSSALATSSALSFDGTKLLASYASTTSLTSSGSAYFGTAGGNVGIGTTTPNLGLTVTSDNGNGWAATFASAGSASKVILGTRLGVPSVSGLLANGSNYTNITFNPEGVGSVGIGTTTFMNTQGLYVNESGFFAGGSEDPGGSNPSPGTYIGFSRAGGYGFIQAKKTGVASYNLILNPAAGGGNIGIGTVGPVSPLNVNLAGGDEDGVVRIDATTRPSLTFVNTGVQAWAQYIDTADSNKFKIGPANSGVSNTSATLTLTTAGRVGIGTTSPSADLLVVQGTAEFGADTEFKAYSGSSNIVIDTGSSGSDSYVTFEENNVMRWRTFNIGSTDAYTILDEESDTGVSLAQDGTSWSAASDERLKDNIQTLSILDRITKFRAVSFNWKSNGNHDIGVIAQEIFSVFPELVSVGDQADETPSLLEGTAWTVSYDKLGALALQGVKELLERFSALTTTVAGFAESFTSRVIRTERLCVTDAAGETCLTRSELNALLSSGGAAPVAPPAEEPTPEEPPAEEPPAEELPPAPVEEVII